MLENLRRSRQAINFTTNVPTILDLNLSQSEQIFSENWRWVPLFSKYSQYYEKLLELTIDAE